MPAARTDAGQKAIVAALREVGCSVQLLHEVGKGCPDLLVGVPTARKNILMEVKEPTGKLNEAQEDWHAAWRGQVSVVRSPYDALELVRAASRVKGPWSKGMRLGKNRGSQDQRLEEST